MAGSHVKLEPPSTSDHAPCVSDINHHSASALSDTSTMAGSTPVPGMCENRANEGAQLDLLGHPVQKLVQLIKDLEQLGVETKKLPLPKIVVVGDQSAGKSSVRLAMFVSSIRALTNTRVAYRGYQRYQGPSQ
jgi:hypothetical protein